MLNTNHTNLSNQYDCPATFTRVEWRRGQECTYVAIRFWRSDMSCTGRIELYRRVDGCEELLGYADEWHTGAAGRFATRMIDAARNGGASHTDTAARGAMLELR